MFNNLENKTELHMSLSNYLELNTKELIEKFKSEISFNKIEMLENLPKPKFQKNLYGFQKYLSAFIIIFIFSSFYLLFVNNDKRDRDYALVPELPEIYLPIVEKADMQDVQDNTKIKSEISNQVIESFNSSSAVASNVKNNLESDNTITLKLLNPTWLQLRDTSNEIILSKLMDKDEEFSFDMDLSYNITAGNAGNILVIINNEVRGKIGKYGEVVDSIVLDYNFNQ